MLSRRQKFYLASSHFVKAVLLPLLKDGFPSSVPKYPAQKALDQ